MKPIKIDLSQPFENVLARVFAAPVDAKAKSQSFAETRLKRVSPKQGDPERTRRAEVKKVVRSLYEAAHGRQVETPIGLINIAPPVAAFLKEKPFYIETQVDFLLAALTRIIEMSSRVRERPLAQAQNRTVQNSISNRKWPHKRGPALLTTSTYD
jgi:hypothetical protein